MFKTLAEKVAPERCAVLIVDVQNDFCAEGGAMHREGRDLTLVKGMVPRLAAFVDAARTAKVPLVWIRNVYNTGPNWYLSEVWLEQAHRRRRGAYLSIPVCEPDNWNGDFYQIKPIPDEVIVTKHRYGAFESSDLDLVLRSRGIRTVIMTGVATNVCVETTARQAFLRDYYVVFTSDCTATYSQAEHDATLHNIDSFFGAVVTADEVRTCWPLPSIRLRAAAG
ncbi:MAG: isochorismatase family cysteine hydrolase [Xanthobacteraceae bacterium]